MSWHVDDNHDPWAPLDHVGDVDMVNNDLDIMDVSDDEHVRAAPYLNSSPGWVTQKKAHAFIHGRHSTAHLAKAQAYQALRTPTSAQSFLGLDHALGLCKVEDVRSQPVDRDAGYATNDQSGHVPNHAAIINCLLQKRDLIEPCGMVYLIVDNRGPAEVEHWPAFARWWSSRHELVGPQNEKTDVLWIQANQDSGLCDVPYYWGGVFVLEAARFLYPSIHFGLIDND